MGNCGAKMASYNDGAKMACQCPSCRAARQGKPMMNYGAQMAGEKPWTSKYCKF